MRFGEKIRALRAAQGFTQAQLAAELGITVRTLQNYEQGRMYPKNTAVYGRLADVFGVSADYLLSEADRCLSDAQDRGGSAARRDLDELLSELGGLFAGGTLAESELDAVMRSLTEAYWAAKDKNRKYTPKKYL